VTKDKMNKTVYLMKKFILLFLFLFLGCTAVMVNRKSDPLQDTYCNGWHIFTKPLDSIPSMTVLKALIKKSDIALSRRDSVLYIAIFHSQDRHGETFNLCHYFIDDTIEFKTEKTSGSDYTDMLPDNCPVVDSLLISDHARMFFKVNSRIISIAKDSIQVFPKSMTYKIHGGPP
jgi:hypothetical protein